MTPSGEKSLFFNSLNRSRLFGAALALLLTSSAAFAQLAGRPGAFERIGFGARAMGMANAMTAVTTGDVTSFYNPAVMPFLSGHAASVSYGIHTLDRSLNTVAYSQSVKPTAGISFGILNAGVRHIDGRDADGFQTEEYSTSENQFSFGFANRMSRVISAGIGLKVYYYSLFDKVSSTTVGVDAGVAAHITDRLTLAAVLQDVGAKYKWDTSKIYGEAGSSTTEPFPQLKKLGVAYDFGDNMGIVTAEVVVSNARSTTFRAGAEFNLSENFTIRGGLDNLDTRQPELAAPAFGFTVRTSLESWTPAVNYAYVVEPFGLSGIHVVSLSTNF